MRPIAINCNIHIPSHPSKQKSIKLLSTIRNLSCSNLAYKVEKSKIETEGFFLCLSSSFIASITGLLLCTTQKVLTPVKHLHFVFV